MNNASLSRTVLSFRASESVNNRRHFEGVFRYAREHGWNVHAFEYFRSEDDPLYWRDPESGERTGLRELLDFWNPDGCVVDCGAVERPLPSSSFGRIPVVFLDLYSRADNSAVAGISSDNRRIAEAAARELLKFDYGDYAFVPATRDHPWSVERGKEFARLVRMNRRSVHVFDGGDTKKFQMSEWRGRLLEWLVALPKPCGLFAANDFVGKNVLDLCRAAKIGVPSDIAVVGVDDDQQICENTVPTLTSIRQDYENGGYSACALLDRLMSKPKTKPQKLLYGIACVTRRESSCMCGDRRVRKAIEFIRRHACERIGLDDVAREMGCSRRLATQLFRLSQRQSILDSIHDERLKRVKMLLANPRHDMKSLPDFCGYKSLVDLRRVFKARTGETIGAFMRRTICLLLVLVGISGFAAADFYRVEKLADGWAAVDASGCSELLLGVDQVRWAGMRCERMGWRRPYEEHNAAHYGSRREWEDETLARQKELKSAFLDLAAERYFRVTTEAIRRHDPNHLILGCRFAGLDGAPVALWKAAGRFCDVITFNLWVDAEGRQHPDIDFVPETAVVLAPGARHVPPSPMGARAVVAHE